MEVKRGVIFTMEAMLAVTITSMVLAVLYTNYLPKMTLEQHRLAEDALAMLKLDNRIQTNSSYQIESILNNTTPHHRLEIYRYRSDSTLVDKTVFGEELGTDASVARGSFVDDRYYYLAVLAVWR